jgi:hypothetical protein
VLARRASDGTSQVMMSEMQHASVGSAETVDAGLLFSGFPGTKGRVTCACGSTTSGFEPRTTVANEYASVPGSPSGDAPRND